MGKEIGGFPETHDMSASYRIGFLQGKGPAAVLLLHGLTGTPSEVEPLGRVLARKYKVLIPWLPGHGESPRALWGVRWEDWARTAEEAYDYLAAQNSRVFVGGLSMGACLSLHLGLSRRPAGVISMAAPIHIRDPRYRGLAFFRFLQRSTGNLTGGLRDPKARHETYDTCPTDSLYELKKLADVLSPRLGDLRSPLLVIQGRQDSMVPVSNAEYLFRLAGSKKKHLRFMDRSDHVLPLDYDKEKVFRCVGRFIASEGRVC